MWDVDNNRKLKIVLILAVLVMILPAAASYKWEQKIDFVNIKTTVTSTNWTPSSGTPGIIEWDMNAYDKVSEIYFEGVIDLDWSGIPNGFGTGKVRLIDLTNGVGINESEVATPGSPGLVRSGNLTYLFNNTFVNLSVQGKGGDSLSTVSIFSGRIVIVQDGNITKTRTYIPIGMGGYTTTGCIGANQSVAVEIVYPKRWLWNSSDFPNNSNISFHTTIYAGSNKTISSLRAVDGTEHVTYLGTTSTSPQYFKSSNVNLTNGKLYTSGLCTQGVFTSAVQRNAFIVVDQIVDPNNPKTVLLWQAENTQRITNSESPVASGEQQSYFNVTNFNGASFSSKLDHTLKHTSVGSKAIFDMVINNDNLTGSYFETLSNSFVYNVSSIENFNQSYGLKARIWTNDSSPGNTIISSARFLIFVNGLPPADETKGRNAIVEGINNIIPNATIYTDFEVDVRYFNGVQKTGKFDKVAFLGNQRWVFNYVTSGENFTNVSSSSYNVFNVWENSSLSYIEIVGQVEEFINETLL